MIGLSQASDLSVVSVKLMYKDNHTSTKAVYREFKEYTEEPYWSKPESIDVIVTVKNSGDDKMRFMLQPELYVLLKKNPQATYPRMNTKEADLKNTTDKPVWIWNRSDYAGGFQNIEQNEQKTIIIKNIGIQFYFTPTEYIIEGIAIRVFANVSTAQGGKDTNNTNNISEALIYYHE
jgi:hypothetical protein